MSPDLNVNDLGFYNRYTLFLDFMDVTYWLSFSKGLGLDTTVSKVSHMVIYALIRKSGVP